MPPTTPPPRLSLLLARAAPVAVIFRRGPSKHVELVRWDTAADVFERGHWFNGRIYDRRSDLSPNGEPLVYFASQFNRHTIRTDSDYTYAWTAVSRVPWLTALALWPKGDCWWGGGLFGGDRTLLLNHRPSEATPHPRHHPRGLKVEPNPDACGEDDPLYSRRLERDGWRMEREGEWSPIGQWKGYRTAVSELCVRGHRAHRLSVVKQRSIEGWRRVEQFHVRGADGSGILPLERADWADWDFAGRLIVLRGGAVWVADVAGGELQPLRQLIDLTGDVLVPLESPAAAREW